MQLDLKPSVSTFLLVLIIVIVGVPLVKFAANKWPVPGVTDLVNSI